MMAPPKDRYNGVWLIFFMLGLGTLLPWNFFMTATMYFTSRLAEPTSDRLAPADSDGEDLAPYNVSLGNDTGMRSLEPPRTQLQSKFNNVMTLCAMLPLLVFTCLNSILHRRISQNIRIAGSLVAIFLVFLLTAIFVKIEFSPVTFFTVTMIKIVFINSFGALLQGSLFGLAALFPASYTAPIMSGQGLAGTFAAFSMICALASGSALEDSAFGYFITACAVILLALVSYLALGKLPGMDSKLLPLLVALRLVFLPLFMLCNVLPRSYLPVLLAHDAWYICIMLLFALSNGYLASLCMCFGPKKVNVQEAETAGAIMAFFLSLGLALGAGFSFLLRILV
ncbi:equilibrative nucleoside transporter 1 [Anomaloglossus baeobatrachus]|uniref:equilibrative nucleoside transporter 1 n=1 Tax=Anomaloglossus baeobatrachus TaxID=238106 RepID=UPI003F4F6C52